jgi:hypothetical protein
LNNETFLKQVATAHKDRIEAEKDGIETDRNLLKDETVRLETLSQKLQSELESMTQRFTDLESARQQLQAEKDNTESARQRLQSEKEILFREFVGLQNHLAQIENSMSWKMIGGFRKIKVRLAPTGTKRRAFYDMGLKSLRVITTEGFYGFTTRVKRRMRFSRWFMRMKGRLRRSPVPSINTVCSLPMDLAFSRKPVSIVMPVYNGFECIGDCINSILVHTDLSYHSLNLINDQSTDPRITEYLCQLDKKKNGKHKALATKITSGL